MGKGMEVLKQLKMELPHHSRIHLWVFIQKNRNQALEELPALPGHRSVLHDGQDMGTTSMSVEG